MSSVTVAVSTVKPLTVAPPVKVSALLVLAPRPVTLDKVSASAVKYVEVSNDRVPSPLIVFTNPLVVIPASLVKVRMSGIWESVNPEISEMLPVVITVPEALGKV